MEASISTMLGWTVLPLEERAPVFRSGGRSAPEWSVRASAAMDRYAGGEDAAFQELYRLLSPGLFRFCTCLAGRNDAEELLQEVFLKMHRARASFCQGSSVVAWSYAIARSTNIDRARRRKRRPETPTEGTTLATRAAPNSCNPDSCSDERQLTVVFEAALQQLSETLRAAFVLVRISGMSCAEAAGVLGISVNAIKQRVHRASEQLKDALQLAGYACELSD